MADEYVKGRLPQESNPTPGRYPGFVASHDVSEDGSQDMRITGKKNPLPSMLYGIDSEGNPKPVNVDENGNVLTQLTGSIVEYDAPVGFSWRDSPLKNRIFKNIQTNSLYTDLDVSEMEIKNDGKTYYVSVDGDRNNDGLSKESPLESIWRAMDKPDVGTILVESGVYHRRIGFHSLRSDLKINIKSVNGDVIVTQHDPVEWTEVEGYDGVYRANRTNAFSVIDAKENPYCIFEEMESLDDVAVKENSWFNDDGIVYVNPKRRADSNLMIMLSSYNGFTGDSDIYLEGINFIGGAYPLLIESEEEKKPPRLYAKNCSFGYSFGFGEGSNGLNVKGAGEVILQGCSALYNKADGFNYHEKDGNIPRVIEIDCEGYNNGITEQDNGSTLHGGAKAIRINCKYYDNKGPNVIDVNDNTESLNIGVESSYSNNDFIAPEVFSVGQHTGKATMFLDNCSGYGADIRVGTESKLFIKDSKIPKNPVDGKVYEY